MRFFQKIFIGMLLLRLFTVPVIAEETQQLEGITIFGNQELPKSLVIVPWKAAPQGRLEGWSLERDMEDALRPIDRDVFYRELRYYQLVHGVE
jgi:hypothetical protein